MTLKTARVRREAGMRFRAENEVGHSIVLDERAGGAGPSPLEGMLASLAACAAMDVISILLKKRQHVTAYSVEVVGDQRDEYPKIFPRIDVVHVIEGQTLDETAVRRAIFLSATKYCTVSATISSGATEIHHRFRIVRTMAADGEARETHGEVTVTGPYRSVEPVE